MPRRGRPKGLLKLAERLGSLGVSADDSAELLSVERALHRWSERECNGDIETDDDGTAWAVCRFGVGSSRRRTPNLEARALRKLGRIMASYPGLAAYVQGDPRGVALYLYRVSDLARYAYPIESVYPQVGVAVYPGE